MIKMLLLYILVVAFAMTVWFFSSSIFSKIGKPFVDNTKKFKKNMGEK